MGAIRASGESLRLGVGAAGLGAFASKIGGADLDGAAHFEEARAHAAADALLEGIFARGGDELAVGETGGFTVGRGIVEIVGGDDGRAFFVVARVENDADNVADPVGGFAGAEVVEDEDFDGANRVEDGHLGGFAGGIVAGLDFFEEFAVVAEKAAVAADDELFDGGDGEMRFAYARGAHEEETFVGAAGKIARESFGVALGELERLRVLRGPGFAVGEIGDVAFEVAVFVAFGDAGALENASGAIFHAAIAGYGEFTGAVGTGNELPSGAAAELAIFEGHRGRVERQDTRATGRRQAKLWTICE
jgi:hypothetical protein